MTGLNVELRRSLASAITRGPTASAKGMHIGPDNKEGSLGWAYVNTLVDARVPFCVRPQDDVVTLDADASDPEGEHAALGEIERVLTEAGITSVVIASSGVSSSRRHLFARVQSSELRATVARIAGRAGIDRRNGTSGMIRPPGTLHRDGTWPVLVSHSGDWSAALESLASTGEHRAFEARRASRLPDHAYQLLVSGDRTGRFKSSSELAMSVICSAENAGFPKEQLRSMFANPDNTGAASYAKRTAGRRGRADADRWFDQSWAQAARTGAEFRDRFPIGGTSRALDALAELFWDNEHTLDSRRASSLVTVMDAAVSMARAWNHASLDTPLSLRTLEERSGKARKTCGRAVDVLVELGWLELTMGHRPDLAARYRLRAPDELHQAWVGRIDQLSERLLEGGISDQPVEPLRASQRRGPSSIELPITVDTTGVEMTPPLPPSGGVRRPWGTSDAMVGLSNHDGFAVGSLGHGAWRVARRLGTAATSNISDLVEATGFSRRTVQRHLRALSAAGLAYRTSDGWLLADLDDAALDAVLNEQAEQAGKAGRHARVLDTNKAERELRERAMALNPGLASRWRGSGRNRDRLAGRITRLERMPA